MWHSSPARFFVSFVLFFVSSIHIFCSFPLLVFPSSTLVLPAQVGDQEWREHRNVEALDEEMFLRTTATLLENKITRDLVDFDNHLDDLKADWRNLELNSLINDC